MQSPPTSVSTGLALKSLIVGRFRERFPEVELRLRGAGRAEGLCLLEAGDSDLHCGAMDDRSQTRAPTYNVLHQDYTFNIHRRSGRLGKLVIRSVIAIQKCRASFKISRKCRADSFFSLSLQALLKE